MGVKEAVCDAPPVVCLCHRLSLNRLMRISVAREVLGVSSDASLSQVWLLSETLHFLVDVIPPNTVEICARLSPLSRRIGSRFLRGMHLILNDPLFKGL